ncbi:MAG: M1 family aminopeptidase [Gemmataceae bacterium]
MRRPLLALFLFAQVAAAQEPLRTAGDRPIDIKHIRLDLKVDLPKKTVDATATIAFAPTRMLTTFALDAVEFEVKAVKVAKGDAKPSDAPFAHDGQKLAIDLDPQWPAGQAGTLTIDYRVRDPKAGLYFFGPTPTDPDVPYTVWSQGESIYNRHWFPSLDHPDQKQTTEIVATVADGYEVLSNGKLLSKKPNGDGTVTFHWKQDKPHVAYLVTLVVGKYDIVREDWRGREVSYYVPAGRGKEIATTFSRTREMLDVFSKRFGVEYPWDKYAQVVVEQFVMGGMENTSATTLTDSALHDQRSLLDGDADGLIAHELGHQWWGDLVTCRDWAHLWLNEGFASYCEVIWDEHRHGQDAAQYDLWAKAGGAKAGGKDRPVVDRRYGSPDSMFDGRAYPKGAWVLNMLRAQLGDDVFFKGLQSYATEHRHKSVETIDLRRSMEQISGKNLERFFYDWTERPGHPNLNVSVSYLPDTKQLKVVVKQTQPGEPFHFSLPMDIYASGSSQPIPFKPEVTEKEHTFFVNVPTRPRMVLTDPSQTVLCDLNEDKGRDLWTEQLKAAPSVASRLRAVAYFGKTKLPADRDTLATALFDEKFYGVQRSIAGALGDIGGDVARDALAKGLTLPDARVRLSCVTELGKFRKDEKAIAVVRGKMKDGDESYTVESQLIESYARLKPDDAIAIILPNLAKESRNEATRRAALRALGATQDWGVLDTLVLWSGKGKPATCRAGAIAAIGELVRTANPTEDQQQKVTKLLVSYLDGEGRQVRRAAVTTLRELGRSAAPSLPALEAIARHDPDLRVQEAAKRAAEEIRKNAPVPLELTRLKDELEKLRKANAGLQERVDKLDKAEKKN